MESRHRPPLKAQAGIEYSALSCRRHSAVLTEFGAVDDGKTSNTEAFRDAISTLSPMAADGGVQLIVPPGKWLTGSFNLTSHFTLFIQKGATLLASQNEITQYGRGYFSMTNLNTEYPVVAPLPSYGRGRDAPGPRFASLISGTNLTDVIITVYCENVIIKGVTILAPIDSPNTDGIDPDSCTNTLIEDCYVVSGDDCIAVKSGWDQYGIKTAMPTQQLSIRRLTCISPDSAGVALGSEMSGGIKDVRIEDITLIQTQSAIRIKTAVGRGGYVKDIFARRVTMKTMKYVFWMSGAYNQHADGKWDAKALPVVKNINYRDMTAENVTIAAWLEGIKNDPFTGICMSNVSILLSPKPKKLQWNCTDIAGVTSKVTPEPCSLLPEKAKPVDCAFPEDKIPIESVVMKKCVA
ncbi:unnamed protein product [Arabis nemorensis]|uniref:Pectate lyase superfamily protein domain-containing protein n=1 Tax=Arabis nemorensis TaxID=586526 RepID=A0A565CV56_9BRAS|nr:unnamed protein product [Arabis nemorensis]